MSYQEVGQDISCNLGSTNITNMIKSPDFGKSIETAIRALTSVSDKTSIKAVPSVERGNNDYNSVGLGAMGLHTALATNEIYYGSDEAIEFTDAYFMALRYHALKASNKIAKEKGKSFYEFEKSAYADGSYIKERYIDVEEFTFKFEKVAKLLENVGLPTKNDWEELNESIKEYGLYNAFLLTIAP